MSTKATIAHDSLFHLYEEFFDDDGLYLEMDGPNIEFTAYKDRITVRIPENVLKAILDNSDKIKEFIERDHSWRFESEE